MHLDINGRCCSFSTSSAVLFIHKFIICCFVFAQWELIIRKVPLSETAFQVLKAHKKESNNILVFCTKNGNILNTSNIRRSFQRILSKSGIEKCSFHTLRHTFATRLFEKGIPAKIVSELLGHSKVSHTLDIYTHCTPSIKSEAVKVLDSCAL